MESSAKPPTSRLRRWTRRLLIGTVLIGITLRASVGVFLPGILDGVAQSRGLSIRYENLDFSIFTGSLELWKLEVRKASAAGPGSDTPEEGELLTLLEFLTADVEVSALLRGELIVHRAEIDGLDIYANRESAQSGWSLASVLPQEDSSSSEAEIPDEAQEPEEEPEFAGYDLSLPLELRAVRLQHLQLHLNDGARSPAFQTRMELNVRLTDLGLADRAARIEVFAHGTQWLDALELEGRFRSQGTELSANLDCRVRGLHIGRLQSYLAPLGLRPKADRLDMGMSCEVEIRGVDGGNQALTMEASLRDIELLADQKECFAIDELALSMPRIAPGEVQIETSTLRGVRGNATRGAHGLLSVAGFEFVGRPSAQAESTEPESDAEPEPERPTQPGLQASPKTLGLHIAALRLEDCELSFLDESFVPAQDLRWKISAAQLTDIRLEEGHSIGLQAMMSSPQILDELQVHGELVPFGPQKTVRLELEVKGIQPQRVLPYLAAMGLQSTFESGHFAAKLNAQLKEGEDGLLRADLQLKDIALNDRSELFAIDELGLKGLRYNPTDGSLHMGEVLWQGTRVSLRRDAERNLHFFGLATGAAQDSLVARAPAAQQAATGTPSSKPAAPDDRAESATSPSKPAQPKARLPRITIERIAWTNTAFHFVDQSFRPARELKLADLGFEMRGLDLGGSPAGGARPAAGFKLWFKADGLAKELEATGTLQTQPGPLDLALKATCRGRELSYEALAPWLAELGVEPLMKQGELDLEFTARFAQTDTGMQGDLLLANLRFAEGERTYLALDEFSLPAWKWNDAGLTNQGLVVRGPLIDLQRDEQGALLALGLRVLPQAPAGQTTPAGASAAPASAQPAEVEAPASEAPSSPLTFDLGTLALQDAKLLWKDAAVPGGVDTALVLGIELADLSFGAGQAPSPFRLTLSADGGLGSLQMNGELGLAPERVHFKSDLSMEQIRAGVFAPYFPPGVTMPMENGRMTAQFSASYEARPTGDGFALGLAVNAVDYRAEGAQHPLFAIEDMQLAASRLDPEAAHFAIDQIQLSGVELDTRRKADGSLHLFGLALEGTSQTSSQATQQVVAEAQPSEVAPKASNELEDPAPVAPNSAPGERKIPTVTIGALDVGIAHLRFLDETSSAAKPFDAGLRLSLPRATTLISPEAADLPPIELSIDGFATPIVQTLAAKIVLTPFQEEPGLGVSFEASGLRGLGLTEVMPELEEQLDGSALEGGHFSTAFQGHLNLRRPSPVDFDLSTGFGLGVDFERLSFVPQPGAEELLALKNLNVAVKSIRPGSGVVHVERIELVEPKLHISKSDQGFHLLGLTLLTPGAQGEVASATAEEPRGEVITDEQAAKEVASIPPPVDDGPAQFRLDEFLISGADLSFVDLSVEPAMHLPVTDMDMELKRFSTRTLTHPEPFRFRVALYGGDIQLPKRELGGNLLGGILGSVGSLLGGEGDTPMEARPVFDEILLRGSMSLGPQPKGWTQLRVRALELPTFAGPALESGIDIGDGLLNETAMLHFDGKGGMRVSSNTNISYLSLSEPADGPISSYLKLPAPIDTVLFVLRDEKGDQNIPLNLTIDEGGLTMGAIMGAVGQTLGLIIGDAIASSPMKIIGGVLDLAGLEDEPLELNGDEMVEVSFYAGDVQAPRDLGAVVAPLLKLLRSDPSLYLVVTHQLSAADLACCDVLANPPAEECMGLAENLRRKRVRLLAGRAEHAAAVRGAYAMGDLHAADGSRARLRQLDLELGATEAALDRVYELTRPGAERGRARRARGTALEVAARRMEAVTRELLKAPITGIGTRVDVRRPRFGVIPDLDQGTIKISVHRRQ